MVGSCWWNSACLCVLWSYNKPWSNGIIISYISFIQATQHSSNKTPECFHANTNLNATFAKECVKNKTSSQILHSACGKPKRDDFCKTLFRSWFLENNTKRDDVRQWHVSCAIYVAAIWGASLCASGVAPSMAVARMTKLHAPGRAISTHSTSSTEY